MTFARLIEALRARLGLEQSDAQLDEEIRQHIEIETENQIRRGLSAVHARARALEVFGDPRRIAQATRDARPERPLAGIREDARRAIRMLRRYPAFTALALTTLAVGLGTTTVAFAAFNLVLLRPLGFMNEQELVVIREQTAEKNVLPPSYPNFADWREGARSFSGVVSELLPFQQTVFVGDEPLSVSSMGVSRNFFRTLGVTPAIGREFSEQENAAGGPAVIMVSHDFWANRLARRPELGTLRVRDRVMEIVGVLPAGLRLVGEADIVTPHEQEPGTSRTGSNYVVIARLAPTATIETARAEMAALSREMLAEYGSATKAVDVVITPLRNNIIGNDDRKTVAAVFGAAVLLLLITCMNLVGAQLGRGLGRVREMGVRTALGASRTRLVRQLLMESSVLAAIGAAMGLLMSVVLTKLVRIAGAPVIPRLAELTVDGRALAFGAMVTLVTLVLVGLYPAMRLATRTAGDVVRGASKNPGAAPRSRAWPVLVGFQIAVAVALVVGSTLLARTVQKIMASDFGLDPKGVVAATLTGGAPMSPPEIERARGALAALPGVSGAAVVTRSPLTWWNNAGPVLRQGDSPDKWPAVAGFRVISPEYFTVMRQRVVTGRAFAASDDSASAKVAIITTGLAAKLWPNEEPVGKQVRTVYLEDQWLTVVGVVAEASHWQMERGAQHELFVPTVQQPRRARGQMVMMVRASRDPHLIVPAVRARLRELVPTRPVTVDVMTDQLARGAADRRFAMLAFASFAVVALWLAALGIYGVMSYSVNARKHEIGVRIALGATAGSVQRLMLRGAAAMALGGLAIGLVASSFAAGFVKSLLYEVTQFDPMAYWGAAAFILVATLAGAYLPARRSSRVDPIVVMRGD